MRTVHSKLPRAEEGPGEDTALNAASAGSSSRDVDAFLSKKARR